MRLLGALGAVLLSIAIAVITILRNDPPPKRGRRFDTDRQSRYSEEVRRARWRKTHVAQHTRNYLTEITP